ncbi:dipeptide/oligopeptide/nickel ABC transporter permease/ATP-binding protein [Streptomyces echinatus]|uniref:Oligopeptide/dipeptide ABC transporter ATP-binding protein n=1 Tax=Streptomyces echinatus TaxID=67293 RepID=A0A7W9PR00_9ACTN|nr:oligopeptide/dipeptide ABC transporter ATP-binding protein [Streptomyces echinatus]MBB5926333.1 oligopeptide/dipeptide ABC transporter ATP-binding protein [Streptomyces echinatus]
MGVITLAMLGSLAVLAVAGAVVWGQQADRPDPSAVLRGPTAGHPLGTDRLGRDLLARLLAATWPSLLPAVAATLLGAAAGITLGALTAVVGGRAARLLGALINLLLAFPALLVAMFFAALFGAGAGGAVFALAVACAPGFARITQTLAAQVAGTDFMAAARVLGLRRHRLLLRHVLPHIAEPLMLNTAVAAGSALVALSGLSFLGLGVQPPSYDWGLMLSQGLDRIYTEPLPAVAPGIAIVYATVAFQLLGEMLAGAAVRQARPRPEEEPVAHAARADRPASTDHVLEVEDLRVVLPTADGVVRPVRGVTLTLRRGELVGLVGESGSGKSLAALAVADLLPDDARVTWTTHRFLGADAESLTREQRRRQLATGMALIFQNPASAFNPSLRLGRQMTEAVRAHRGTPRAEAVEQALAQLQRVGLPAGRRLLRSRPFQLSGGQRQRVAIAAASMMRPDLIIADEPTTALDVTVQRQIMDLLRRVRREDATAILFISHDIALVADACDRVLVMYGGTIVENLPARELAAGARHPYTRMLVASVPDLAADRDPPPLTIEGGPPDPCGTAPGCPFHDRCPHRLDRCAVDSPVLSPLRPEHEVACWRPLPAAPLGGARETEEVEK